MAMESVSLRLYSDAYRATEFQRTDLYQSSEINPFSLPGVSLFRFP